jgi:hypothetical protein
LLGGLHILLIFIKTLLKCIKYVVSQRTTVSYGTVYTVRHCTGQYSYSNIQYPEKTIRTVRKKRPTPGPAATTNEGLPVADCGHNNPHHSFEY